MNDCDKVENLKEISNIQIQSKKKFDSWKLYFCLHLSKIIIVPWIKTNTEYFQKYLASTWTCIFTAIWSPGSGQLAATNWRKIQLWLRENCDLAVSVSPSSDGCDSPTFRGKVFVKRLVGLIHRRWSTSGVESVCQELWCIYNELWCI